MRWYLIVVFFFLRFYLFMRDTERQRHRQREKQAPSREPNAGLDPGSPGSRPRLPAALNCCATGAARQLLLKLDIYLPYNLAILRFYSREMKVCVHTKTWTKIFIAALFQIPPNWKQHKSHQQRNKL